jgi:hypothetical protein
VNPGAPGLTFLLSRVLVILPKGTSSHFKKPLFFAKGPSCWGGKVKGQESRARRPHPSSFPLLLGNALFERLLLCLARTDSAVLLGWRVAQQHLSFRGAKIAEVMEYTSNCQRACAREGARHCSTPGWLYVDKCSLIGIIREIAPWACDFPRALHTVCASPWLPIWGIASLRSRARPPVAAL